MIYVYDYYFVPWDVNISELLICMRNAEDKKRICSKRGSGKRLNDTQRLEIINKFQKNQAPSKRKVAKEFGVSEKAIRSTLSQADEIIRRSSSRSSLSRDKTFRMIKPKFPELEDELWAWIEEEQRLNTAHSSISIIKKATQIAKDLEIETFKGSWQWLQRFKNRRNMDSITHHEENNLPVDTINVAKNSAEI